MVETYIHIGITGGSCIMALGVLYIFTNSLVASLLATRAIWPSNQEPTASMFANKYDIRLR